MSLFDDQYIDLCRRIIKDGEQIVNYKSTTNKNHAVSMPNHVSQASSGAETIRSPHQILQFDLDKEFPILTSKQVAFKSAVIEILWIYQAASNDVRWLQNAMLKSGTNGKLRKTAAIRGAILTKFLLEIILICQRRILRIQLVLLTAGLLTDIIS